MKNTGRKTLSLAAIALTSLLTPVASAAEVSLGLAHQLLLVDHSGSLRGQYEWIGDIATRLEASGASTRFGLMEFSENAHPLLLGNKPFGNAREFNAGIKRLKRGGASEDGYQAIEQAVTDYSLEKRIASHIILISDEHRSVTNGAVTADSLALKIFNANVPVTAIVSAHFFCDDGSMALGMNANGGIIADSNGHVSYCTIGKVAEPNQSSHSVTDYVDLALSSGGSVWDIRVPRSGIRGSTLFAQAFTEIHSGAIDQQLLAVDAIPKVTYFPDSPRAGDVVSFDASASTATGDNYLSALQWDFESDKQVDSSGTNVAHVFSTPGVYKVTLALSTNRSAASSAHTFEITVTE